VLGRRCGLRRNGPSVQGAGPRGLTAHMEGVIALKQSAPAGYGPITMGDWLHP